MMGRMPCTHLGYPGGNQLVPSLTRTSLCLDPSSVCLKQSCCLGGERKASLGSQKPSKMGNSIHNRIAFSVTYGSCWEESSRQKCDKKMQCCEVVFVSGMEEKEVEGCRGQGQCQDTMYWCSCH